MPVIREIPVGEIRPNQPSPDCITRKRLWQSWLEHAGENGLIQPVLVRQLLSRGIRIDAGHRRWKAVQRLEWPTMRTVVENHTDTGIGSDGPGGEHSAPGSELYGGGRSIAGLIESTGITQQEAAQRLGKSQPAVANKLRLLRLPGWVQEIVEQGQLSERHARALLRLEREEDLRQVLEQVRRRNLTVEQTEALIEDCLAGPKEPVTRIVLLRDYRLFMNTLNRAVQTMAQAGIQVEQQSREEGEYLEVQIRVPKVQAYRTATSGKTTTGTRSVSG